MTNKEKQWRKVVSLFKAEAKRRYQVGDIISVPNSSGNYRIHKGSSYRVYFDEAYEYIDSSIVVTVGDSKTSLIGVVYDGFRGSWTIPYDKYDNRINVRERCDWNMSEEILNEVNKYIDYDTN